MSLISISSLNKSYGNRPVIKDFSFNVEDGEFIGSNKGLGFLILTNYYTSDTAMVFTAVILSSLLGIFLYYILHYFENRKITWTSPID